jgi:hypothetical protein
MTNNKIKINTKKLSYKEVVILRDQLLENFGATRDFAKNSYRMLRYFDDSSYNALKLTDFKKINVNDDLKLLFFKIFRVAYERHAIMLSLANAIINGLDVDKTMLDTFIKLVEYSKITLDDFDDFKEDTYKEILALLSKKSLAMKYILYYSKITSRYLHRAPLLFSMDELLQIFSLLASRGFTLSEFEIIRRVLLMPTDCNESGMTGLFKSLFIGKIKGFLENKDISKDDLTLLLRCVKYKKVNPNNVEASLAFCKKLHFRERSLDPLQQNIEED